MCERCDLLAAENARLADELAEWRRQASDDAAKPDPALETQAWRLALGVQPRIIRCAQALAQRAGRVVTVDTLAALIVGSEPETFATSALTARVAVCHLRGALSDRAADVEIQTLRGVGYLMPKPDAARLLEMVEAEAEGARHA